MTGAELKNSVKIIGINPNFDDGDEEQFLVAANQAIAEINQIIPPKDTIRICHYPITPIVYAKGITVHFPDNDITFTAEDAQALAFYASGKGQAVLADSEGNTIYSWDIDTGGVFSFFSGNIKTLNGGALPDGVTLTFGGDKKYLIRDVAIYDQLNGDDVTVIKPYGEYTEYDMKSTTYAGANFAGFTREPVLCEGIPVSNRKILYIQGNSLFISNDGYDGEYTVEYRRLPELLTADNISYEIDVDAELAFLLPTRTAYYMYIGVDPEIAKPYGQEYLRLLADAKQILKRDNPETYRNTRGW